MTTFKHLGLSEPILKVISELGFEKPSEIQEESIPYLLTSDKDFIGLAQTGTGKTAAFGWPLLERLDSSHSATQALILSPTRELGQQIAQQLAVFSKHMHKMNVLPVYGGASISAQMKALRKPQHIIIATPGRLIDLIKRKAVKLNQLEYLVLDEADEMLNMGFQQELEKIMSYTPESKATWLFSATMPKEIRKMVNKYMDQPYEVKVNTKNEVNSNIEHQNVFVHQQDKTEALMRFLDLDPDMRGIVFCRTRRNTQKLAEALMKNNYRADAIHGDLSQGQRDRVMKRFKKHDIQLLVATDVAARGIDVSDLTHVFHFNLPDDIPYYTHRSGRTARAGKKGISIAFTDPRDKKQLHKIEKQLDISFKGASVPKSEQVESLRIESFCKDVLKKPINGQGNVDPEIKNKAIDILGNLSKEELIEKFLAHELDKLNIDSGKDFNQKSSKRNHKSKGKFKGGGGNGRNHRKHRKGKAFKRKGKRPRIS